MDGSELFVGSLHFLKLTCNHGPRMGGDVTRKRFSVGFEDGFESSPLARVGMVGNGCASGREPHEFCLKFELELFCRSVDFFRKFPESSIHVFGRGSSRKQARCMVDSLNQLD